MCYSCNKAARGASAARQAFSLLELLVVVAILGLLIAFLFPALAAARTKAHLTECLNGKNQLQLAWLLYATDHNDELVPNGQVTSAIPQTNRQYWWAQGTMNYGEDNSDNTNVNLLIDPLYARLGDYTKTPKIYKCPSDRSTARVGGVEQPRVRSVSMNVYVGRCVDCYSERPTHVGPRTVANIPNSSMQFVFLDEHPDGINGTAFWTSPATEGRVAKIISYPGSSHQGSGTLSFADGHVEAHRWQDDRTKPAVKYENVLVGTNSPGNPDVTWLQQRTYFR